MRREQRDMKRSVVLSVLFEQVRVASVHAEEERNMELAIAASNIDQYKIWGKLPDDLKNMITQKIVEPKPTVDFAECMIEYLFKNKGRAVCLPCS